MLNKIMAAGVVAVGLVGAAGTAQAGKDLDAVKARGQLICGVSTGVAGFASADSPHGTAFENVSFLLDDARTRRALMTSPSFIAASRSW